MVSSRSPAVDHQETLSAVDFQRLARVIQNYSGIKMPADKQTMLEGRLRRRMQEIGITSLEEYCEYLFGGHDYEAELVHLIDAVTTNKTEFFRERAHFDYVRTHAMPALVKAGVRHIKVWSAACSTGAEPYTLAMVIDSFCRSSTSLRYSVLATDICTEVLDQAVAGRFPAAMIDPVPLDMRRDYILQGRDENNEEIRIVPKLREKISFARLNLMDEEYRVERDLDLIFCRNILIYFDKATQIKVLTRLCGHLRLGGYLFLGHSESFLGFDLPLTTVANTIFQRR